MSLELERALAEIPILDVHTHLVGGKLAARGLHDVVALPHGRQRPLCGGVPERGAADPVSRLAVARRGRGADRRGPAVPAAHPEHRSFWGVRIILRDLYGWTEPIDESNWKKLDALIRERADDRSWPHEVLDRAGIERTGHRARPARGRSRRRPACSTPSNGASSRAASGANSTRRSTSWSVAGESRPRAPRRSERAPGRPPSGRSRASTTCTTAVAHYVESIPYDRIISTATHLSTDIDYRPVTR